MSLPRRLIHGPIYAFYAHTRWCALSPIHLLDEAAHAEHLLEQLEGVGVTELGDVGGRAGGEGERRYLAEGRRRGRDQDVCQERYTVCGVSGMVGWWV